MGIQGLEALHARTIAVELEINHATVHYYFPHRVDLLVGVADFALEQFKRDRAKFHEGLTKPGDRLEAELALAEAYCKKTSRFVKVLAGLYVASLAHKEVKAKLQILYKEWSSLIGELNAKASLRKSTPFRDPDILTASLFGIALASHLMDGKLAAKDKVDVVFTSMFG